MPKDDDQMRPLYKYVSSEQRMEQRMEQLRRKKIKVLKLCVAYAYAVKHHLRKESGVNYADYTGLLPSTIIRASEGSYNRNSTQIMTSSPAEYDENNASGQKAQQQRVMVQDSLATLPDQHTPLLSESHRTVEFYADIDQPVISLPLL